jgi:hypothetical protein
MGWFSRERRPTVTAGEVLDRALGRILDAQATQIEAVSTLLTKMADLSTKRAAQALGARGGRISQQKRREKGQGAFLNVGCPLCRDPLFTGVTVELINAHRAHVPLPQTPEPSKNTEGNGSAESN